MKPDRIAAVRENIAEKFGREDASEISEDLIALAFTQEHRNDLRFDHDARRWFRWDGARWRMDNTDLAFSYARELSRRMSEGKKAIAKANVAAGVERFARSDRAHAVNSSIWDTDPLKLGTPAGTVDLRTGMLCEPDPADHITKLTSVVPEDGEPTIWLRFLNEALAGDAEAIRFLQLWMGYCLTGDTREHALLFIHGLAGTGKTVFLNTLTRILGDYAVTAPMDTFNASKFDRHSTELAMLRGARLVTASETQEGRSWDEARIKVLTGGDSISARFMHRDNFTYRPAFKLTIAGNHAPRLVNPDDAMRRRFNIIGFNVKPEKPDLLLEEKLVAEHGRILAWAIEGERLWQQQGLVRPEAVTAATSEYFTEEDLLGQWITERCNVAKTAWELPARLYADWQAFARQHGEEPGSSNSFGKRLAKKGFRSSASNSVRAYRGLELKVQPQGFDHD